MQAHPFDTLPSRRPLLLPELALPAPLTVVMLAPHPDDFDAIAVTMRFLQQHGHLLHVAVLTAGANGVEDGWNGARDAAAKTALREAEQRASCSFFGLAPERLRFLRLWEDENTDAERDRARLRDYLAETAPDLVFLPHGNDSNRTHRRTYESFRDIVAAEGWRLHACLNLDAKTVDMRPDLYMYFDEPDAGWKAQMLRLHRSQQERNLKTRGHGFDQRVLQVNRDAATSAGAPLPYAEVFELQRFG